MILWFFKQHFELLEDHIAAVSEIDLYHCGKFYAVARRFAISADERDKLSEAYVEHVRALSLDRARDEIALLQRMNYYEDAGIQ